MVDISGPRKPYDTVTVVCLKMDQSRHVVTVVCLKFRFLEFQAKSRNYTTFSGKEPYLRLFLKLHLCAMYSLHTKMNAMRVFSVL